LYDRMEDTDAVALWAHVSSPVNLSVFSVSSLLSVFLCFLSYFLSFVPYFLICISFSLLFFDFSFPLFFLCLPFFTTFYIPFLPSLRLAIAPFFIPVFPCSLVFFLSVSPSRLPLLPSFHLYIILPSLSPSLCHPSFLPCRESNPDHPTVQPVASLYTD